jgi:dTDP-4-dehydrorhamnose 3,5-epimerase
MSYSINVEKTTLDGVLIISPSTNFEDFRGNYVELYNKELFFEAGINLEFIQDDISVSRKNVLRGIHGDSKTWKLVSCLRGTFYLVVVNNDENSSEYKKWEAFTLSDVNRNQVLIPPNFGNGHLVMSDESIFHYKQTTTYNRDGQFTIKWNDPKFKFWWPTKAPITSIRDEGL